MSLHRRLACTANATRASLHLLCWHRLQPTAPPSERSRSLPLLRGPSVHCPYFIPVVHKNSPSSLLGHRALPFLYIRSCFCTTRPVHVTQTAHNIAALPVACIGDCATHPHTSFPLSAQESGTRATAPTQHVIPHTFPAPRRHSSPFAAIFQCRWTELLPLTRSSRWCNTHPHTPPSRTSLLH